MPPVQQILYTGQPLQLDLFPAGRLLQVLVPIETLVTSLSHARSKGVWGSGVYTQDSDLVASAVHAGHLDATMIDHVREYVNWKKEQRNHPKSSSSHSSLSTAASSLSSLSAIQSARRPAALLPVQSSKVPAVLQGLEGCVIVLRVHPAQKRYSGTTAHGITSRSWTGASLCSFSIEKCAEMRSSARPPSPPPSPPSSHAQMRRGHSSQDTDSNRALTAAWRKHGPLAAQTIVFSPVDNSPWLKYTGAAVLDDPTKGPTGRTSYGVATGKVELWLETPEGDNTLKLVCTNAPKSVHVVDGQHTRHVAPPPSASVDGPTLSTPQPVPQTPVSAPVVSTANGRVSPPSDAMSIIKNALHEMEEVVDLSKVPSPPLLSVADHPPQRSNVTGATSLATSNSTSALSQSSNEDEEAAQTVLRFHLDQVVGKGRPRNADLDDTTAEPFSNFCWSERGVTLTDDKGEIEATVGRYKVRHPEVTLPQRPSYAQLLEESRAKHESVSHHKRTHDKVQQGPDHKGAAAAKRRRR